MGYFKQRQLEIEAHGYDYIGDKAVCDNCLEDSDLKRFVQERSDQTACSYCGRRDARPIAIPVDDLLAEVGSAVSRDWRSIEGSDFFEGEQMVRSRGTEELLLNEIGWPFANDALGQDIVDAFEIEAWVELNPLRLRRDEALVAGWEEFSRQVRTVTRYLFFNDPEVYEDFGDPRRMLREIHELVDQFGLVHQVERNTPLFRARPSKDASEAYQRAKDLGGPSSEQARTSSRMTPAGIPVFYGALDLDTAIAETLAHATTISTSSRVRISWGTFKTLVPMRVLDLTSLRPVPGFFSPDRDHREALSFLATFRNEVARPIQQDGREHIAYVPTQIVAEYFRHVYEEPNGGHIDGILYPSSARHGGTSCVLFLGAESCCDIEEWDGTDDAHRLGLDRTTTGSSVFRIRWEPESSEED